MPAWLLMVICKAICFESNIYKESFVLTSKTPCLLLWFYRMGLQGTDCILSGSLLQTLFFLFLYFAHSSINTSIFSILLVILLIRTSTKKSFPRSYISLEKKFLTLKKKSFTSLFLKFKHFNNLFILRRLVLNKLNKI